MSKEFNGVTSQTAVAQNSKKTISVYANLVQAKINNFAELIDRKLSKIKIHINDFSNGKGDLATKVYYNLTISELYYLYEEGMNAFKDKKFSSMVSLDTYKILEGINKGLCEIRSLTIEYCPGYDYPIKVRITNGVGEKGKISKDKKYAEFQLSMMDYRMLLRNTVEYVNTYRMIFGSPIMQQGVATMEANRLGDMNESMQIEEEHVSTMDDANETAAPQQNDSVPSINPELHLTSFQVISDFFSYEGSKCCEIVTGGKSYNLFMREVPPELKSSFEDKVQVSAYLFNYNGMLCLDHVA